VSFAKERLGKLAETSEPGRK